MTTSDDGRVAVLLDIDGTLVDSNYLHADAWDRAFVTAGHPVEMWRIHRAIGMDSGKLVERLLGEDADAVAEAVQTEHSRLYMDMTDRLRVMKGARELLQELARRGHVVVLATSAPKDELAVLLDVLHVNEAIDSVTSGEDVSAAKPDPDLIEIALERASLPARRAVMIGDSVWDIEAARRAGVTSIGVRAGGYGAEELLRAGASAVYDDPAHLLAELDQSPISALQIPG
jgi:HAD superfamily hydrolase (TIGR01509 family)